MRVLPRVHDEVNEEWISDKTRFACDGLMRQRLDRPYVRRGGRLQEATWGEALAAVAERLRSADPDRVGAIAGDLQDAESMKAALDLFGALGVRNLTAGRTGRRLAAGRVRAGCSTPPSRDWRRATRCCWWGPTPGARRRC
jgi:NADH-quinone oxidoreductase subunit G